MSGAARAFFLFARAVTRGVRLALICRAGPFGLFRPSLPLGLDARLKNGFPRGQHGRAASALEDTGCPWPKLQQNPDDAASDNDGRVPYLCPSSANAFNGWLNDLKKWPTISPVAKTPATEKNCSGK